MTVKVNDRIIPESAIRYEYDRLVKFYSNHMTAERLKELSDQLQEKAKEQAIGSQLLLDEAAKLDIRVGQDEIDKRYNAMVQDAGGEDAFAGMLEKQELTADMVKKTIEQGCKVDKLVELKVSDIGNPTEEEIEAYFKEHSDDYIKPEMAQVQHILVKLVSDDEKDRETARSKLISIKESIDNGAKFSDKAAAHSECASGQKTGGSLGWVQRGMILPQLDSVIFSTETGKLSEVIESPLGFHILRRTAYEEGGEANYEDAREKIREYLRHLKRGKALASYVEELREKAVIEDDSAQAKG